MSDNVIRPGFFGGGNGPLAPRGGGPHDPDMEARVKRLEDGLQRIETLLVELDKGQRSFGVDLAYLRGRVENLPSTWAMITAIMAGQIALAGILIAALRLTAH